MSVFLAATYMQQRSKFMDSQSQNDSLGVVSPGGIQKSQVVSTGHSMDTGKACANGLFEDQAIPLSSNKTSHNNLFVLPVSSSAKFASTDIRQRTDPVDDLSGQEIKELLQNAEWKVECKECPLCSTGKGICLGMGCLGSKSGKKIMVSCKVKK